MVDTVVVVVAVYVDRCVAGVALVERVVRR